MKHPHRPANFFLSLALACLAGFTVFWLTARWQTGPTQYRDAEFPVSLTLPARWNATRNASGSGNDRIVNVVFSDGANGVTLIIAPKTLTPLIRSSAATSGANLRFFEKDDRVYVLNGQADFVEQLGQSFAFIQ